MPTNSMRQVLPCLRITRRWRSEPGIRCSSSSKRFSENRGNHRVNRTGIDFGGRQLAIYFQKPTQLANDLWQVKLALFLTFQRGTHELASAQFTTSR